MSDLYLLCSPAQCVMWPLTFWMLLPPTSLKKMLVPAACLQAAGPLRGTRSTSPLIPAMGLLLLLCLQPSETRTDPENRTWSQTGPRLKLSHSGRKNDENMQDVGGEVDAWSSIWYRFLLRLFRLCPGITENLLRGCFCAWWRIKTHQWDGRSWGHWNNSVLKQNLQIEAEPD